MVKNILNTYSCLNKQIFQIGRYSLVPLREQDISQIMHWRNSQIKVLRQKEKLTPAIQQKYYQHVIKPTFKEHRPDQILFSFLLNNECIGYGGIVHINWEFKRGEMSFLLDIKRVAQKKLYKQDFITFTNLLKDIAFNSLPLQRLFTETYDCRSQHISILEEAGFVSEGRLRRHIIINGKPMDSLIHGCIAGN